MNQTISTIEKINTHPRVRKIWSRFSFAFYQIRLKSIWSGNIAWIFDRRNFNWFLLIATQRNSIQICSFMVNQKVIFSNCMRRSRFFLEFSGKRAIYWSTIEAELRPFYCQYNVHSSMLYAFGTSKLSVFQYSIGRKANAKIISPVNMEHKLIVIQKHFRMQFLMWVPYTKRIK